MAAKRYIAAAQNENVVFAFRASASAILMFAAKVRCHFSSASGLGRDATDVSSGGSPESGQ